MRSRMAMSGVGCTLLLGVLGSAVSASAATPSYTYDCRLATRGGPAAIRLRISARSATVTMTGAAAQRFNFDPSYAPRGNGGYLRYRVDGSRWVLVEKDLPKGGYALRTGGRGGYLKLEVRHDSFASWRYFCRRGS